MSKFYPLLFVIACVACHHPVSLQTEKSLQSLLDQKEYFKLREQLALDADQISPLKNLYLGANLDNAFNRNEASLEKIQTLLQKYKADIPDSTKANLLQIETDDYFKNFQYAKSAGVFNDLVAHYRHAVDSSTYVGLKNGALLTNALAGVPPQKATIPANTTLQWTRDKVGLFEIPLKKGDSIYSCIFDTRANISSITASYAKKLGLKMLDVSYNVNGTATDASIKSSLGIADSIWLGNILLQHVVFQVMPDEMLYIGAPYNFSLNVILGYPPISQLREIHILKNGSMMIPATPTPGHLNNLALDGADPIVACRIGKDTLCFHFDTGAAGPTELYSTYFHRYKADVMAQGKLDSIHMGGAGGNVVKADVYKMKGFHLGVGSQSAILPEVSVHTDSVGNINGQQFYGNLGQDLISQFNEMIINFDTMYIDFR